MMADEILSNSEEDLTRLLSESDFVVNVMPFTPQTANFFDLEKFKKMKANGVFLNIGRGKSVVEADLITALKERIIAGAYLDVFATEPFPADSELWNFENVFMTPHCADNTWDIMELACKVMKGNLDGYLEAGRDVKGLKSVVNFKVGY